MSFSTRFTSVAVFIPSAVFASSLGTDRVTTWRESAASIPRNNSLDTGKGLFVGGVKLPLALAEPGLIDEYEFVVHPRLAGHGPTLFAGLSKHVDLRLVSRLEFGSGAVAMRYEPRMG